MVEVAGDGDKGRETAMAGTLHLSRSRAEAACSDEYDFT